MFLTCWREQKKPLNSSIIYLSLNSMAFSLPFEFHNPDSKVPRTLCDIYVFTQSETQRNLLLRILFAKDLRVRYFSLDKQLRGLVKQFEVLHQTCIRSFPSLIWQGVLQQNKVKKPLVSCVGSTIQDGALTEIVPPNNSSALHARYSNLFGTYSVPLMLHSGSIFHNANNIAVLGGTYYAAQSLVVKQVQGENSL